MIQSFGQTKRAHPAGASFARIRMALAALMLVAVAACAAPFNADVSRFQSQLPAPAGQSFAIVADDPELAGGLEFAQYASLVAKHMNELGYTAASSPSNADLIVRFDYGVDNGRERIQSRSPYFDPWYGYGRYGRFGGFGGFGGYYGGPWRYGFYDPYFAGGIDSYTVYTSGIKLKIDRAKDGQRLFEGKAQALSTSNRLQYLVPNLVDAMFTDFPGNSGETVRITVAPEGK
ncbi:DUF4136 domain-containing protein [Novosphingobium profundi]|uniref:DUF4136 domain-containing protein n=1 Tax=Novosphingobium profundi TaxID=1774954 RepID=UPI001BD9A964|nr:DUF4136 domain-containing protein [Novosphingobium profundi]MBT0670338.1 DUF4136 domain-containing protein [Novosphingobium profundi]